MVLSGGCVCACVCTCSVVSELSCVRLFATLWTGAHRVPLFMGFSRQEYRTGCHFLLQEIFLTPGIEPTISCVSCIGRQISLPLSILNTVKKIREPLWRDPALLDLGMCQVNPTGLGWNSVPLSLQG